MTSGWTTLLSIVFHMKLGRWCEPGHSWTSHWGDLQGALSPPQSFQAFAFRKAKAQNGVCTLGQGFMRIVLLCNLVLSAPS